MAAFLTEYVNPHFSFAVSAVMGLMIAFYGHNMNPEVESDV